MEARLTTSPVRTRLRSFNVAIAVIVYGDGRMSVSADRSDRSLHSFDHLGAGE